MYLNPSKNNADIAHKVKPQLYLAEIGSSVNISCFSYHTVSWTHNSGPLPSNTIMHHSTENDNEHILEIISIGIHEYGQYTCKGKSIDDNEYSSFISHAAIRCRFLAKSLIDMVNT